MEVSTANVLRAIEQHYSDTPDVIVGHEKLVKVFVVIKALESLPGFQAAEVAAIAHLALQHQITEDSKR